MKRFWNDVKKYYNYEVRAAKTALKSEVANSYLNWIWWILNPLFEMMIYYFIFGFVFKAKEPNFPIFIFVGLTMWSFFNKNVTQSVTLIKKNKPIVSKVYVPKFVLLLTNMMVNGFKMMISWIIVIVMMVVSGVKLSWYLPSFVPIMLALVLITFGVCVNLMHFGVFVEDLSNVVNIVFRLLFYMTGVFYNIDNRIGVDHPMIAKIMTYGNPIALLMHDMRNALVYQASPDWMAVLAWGIFGLLLSMIGVATIYKYENSYVKIL